MFYQDGKQNVFMKHLHHFCRDYSKMENVRGTSPCVKDLWVFFWVVCTSAISEAAYCLIGPLSVWCRSRWCDG